MGCRLTLPRRSSPRQALRIGCAVRAEAHALPFTRDSFDAIICIDAYEYFGTADSYLAYITRFLKPGGQLAIATPAMTRQVRDLGKIPAHIKACVGLPRLATPVRSFTQPGHDLQAAVLTKGPVAVALICATMFHDAPTVRPPRSACSRRFARPGVCEPQGQSQRHRKIFCTQPPAGGHQRKGR